MGVVHPTTNRDRITRKAFEECRDAETPTNLIGHAIAITQAMVRKDIEDSRWYCPVHELLSSSNDCEECDDAMDMNVIINNLLSMKALDE